MCLCAFLSFCLPVFLCWFLLLVQLLFSLFVFFFYGFFLVHLVCLHVFVVVPYLHTGQTHGLRVRGSNYLKDGRKIAAGPSFGALIRADLFRIDGARQAVAVAVTVAALVAVAVAVAVAVMVAEAIAVAVAVAVAVAEAVAAAVGVAATGTVAAPNESKSNQRKH